MIHHLGRDPQPVHRPSFVERVLAVANDTIVCMVGGVTYFQTAVDLTTGDSAFTLADGTIPGLKKAFVCQAAMTANEIVVTVTSGEKGVADADPTGNLTSLSFNADLEEAALEYNAFDTNGRWVVTHLIGATVA